MSIDLLFLLVMVIAAVKGYQRGLIVAVFSLVAIVVGLAAALKLSVVVAGYLQDSGRVSDRWLPLLSFLLVFIAVVLLIRLAANVLQSSVELAWLGWVNRLGGIILYLVIYTLAFSVVLFFLEHARLIGEQTIAHSRIYKYIQPWGPFTMNLIGNLIPAFRDMFGELERFFDNLAQKIPASRASM